MRFIKQLFNLKEIQRPLGRWGLHNKDYLKTDYANIDNCGDLLCQNPADSQNIRECISAEHCHFDLCVCQTRQLTNSTQKITPNTNN